MNRTAAAVIAALAFLPANAQATPIHNVTGASSYYASSERAPSVANPNPAPGAHVRSFYPQFSVTIDTRGRASLRRKTLHMFIDGADVTALSTFAGDTLTYLPRDRIAPGWHDVFLEGSDTAGNTFSESWVFESLAPDEDVGQEYAGFGVIPAGAPGLFPGDFMHFFFIAPDDGFASLRFCGLSQFAFVHVRLSPVFFVTVPVPFDGAFSPFFDCAPNVVFSPFDQFTNVFVPVPFAIAGPGITAPRHSQPWQFRGMQPGIRRPEHSGGVAAPANIYRSAMPVMRVILPSAPRVSAPVQHAAPPGLIRGPVGTRSGGGASGSGTSHSGNPGHPYPH